MRWNSEKGAAVVEFAVVLPLLLVIVFGIVEFGFLMYNQAMITNASREGARFGIIMKDPRHSSTEITNEVTNYCADFLVTFSSGEDPGPSTRICVTDVDLGGSDSETCDVNPAAMDIDPAEDLLTVEVTYDYEFILLPHLVGGLGLTKTLFASSTMRFE
jgi:Flp pilus assembly protein TadG